MSDAHLFILGFIPFKGEKYQFYLKILFLKCLNKTLCTATLHNILCVTLNLTLIQEMYFRNHHLFVPMNVRQETSYCGRRDPVASLQQSWEQRRKLKNPMLHSLKLYRCDFD